MRPGFRQWFAERAELIVLGLTLLATASLVVWWTILLRGEMRTNETLEREALAAEVGITAQQRDERLAEIAARHDRRNVMLVGESTLLALLLSGSLVVLFLLAQRRKQQREDMEKLLQFTSHEFKTPVAGVKGLLQSLAIGSIPDAQRAELIQLGQLECDRLEHLAETILAYQRAMSRDPREGVQPIDARRFIVDLLAHRARTASSGSAEVAEYRGRAGAGGSRWAARDPREPARQCAQVRRRQRAPVGQRRRWTLAARHQRPGTRLPARERGKALRPSQSRQRRRCHAWRRAGSCDRAPAGAPHGRRHLPRTVRVPGRARFSA